MRTWLPALVIASSVSGVAIAGAQEPATDLPPPPHLAYAEGAVELELDGLVEQATPSTALLDGDRVRTRAGRAELVYADGTVVHLDHHTAVEVMSTNRLRLTAGRVAVRTSAAVAETFVVDTAAASIEMAPRGEFTVAADELRHDVAIAVARGVADAETWAGRLVVRAGERAEVPHSGTARVYAYNSARLDAFARWSAERVNAFTYAQSAGQLPYELRPHAPVLDHHGYWGHMPPYGAVWYPRVAVGWRPYFDGRWRQTRYGWTWVGYDPWAWPTHHYGRWGLSGGVWFWIPARVWAPAWVSWAYAPGYVSWAPLGWDGRAVLAFSARLTTHNPWHVWTVLPSHRLGHRASLRPWIVDGGRLPVQIRTGFQVRHAPQRAVERFTPGRTAPRGAARPDVGRPVRDVRRAQPRAGASAPASPQRTGRVWDRDVSRDAERGVTRAPARQPDTTSIREAARPGTPSAVSRYREAWRSGTEGSGGAIRSGGSGGFSRPEGGRGGGTDPRARPPAVTARPAEAAPESVRSPVVTRPTRPDQGRGVVRSGRSDGNTGSAGPARSPGERADPRARPPAATTRPAEAVPGQLRSPGTRSLRPEQGRGVVRRSGAEGSGGDDRGASPGDVGVQGAGRAAWTGGRQQTAPSGAAAPSGRGGNARPATPRAAPPGDGRPSGGRSAAPPQSPRGESGARTRPGGVRRPPP